MQCKEINNLVMKYFDGNISELEREMIIKHNEKCSSCAEELKLLIEAIDLLSKLPEVEAPLGFELRVMEKIKVQRVHCADRKAAALWMVSILGLIIFGWNMLVFSTIPLIRESGILIGAHNLIIYGFGIISEILSNVIVSASVMLGKILIIRNVMLRDYINIVTLIVIVFMGINLLLIHGRKPQEN